MVEQIKDKDLWKLWHVSAGHSYSAHIVARSGQEALDCLKENDGLDDGDMEGLSATEVHPNAEVKVSQWNDNGPWSFEASELIAISLYQNGYQPWVILHSEY